MATKTSKKTTRTKPAAKTSKKATAEKLSQLDAAVKVLKAARKPLNCKAMVEAMATKKLWTSPGGKTPDATLYAAILREIQTKGQEARFTKVDRGLFGLRK